MSARNETRFNLGPQVKGDSHGNLSLSLRQRDHRAQENQRDLLPEESLSGGDPHSPALQRDGDRRRPHPLLDRRPRFARAVPGPADLLRPPPPPSPPPARVWPALCFFFCSPPPPPPRHTEISYGE